MGFEFEIEDQLGRKQILNYAWKFSLRRLSQILLTVCYDYYGALRHALTCYDNATAGIIPTGALLLTHFMGCYSLGIYKLLGALKPDFSGDAGRKVKYWFGMQLVDTLSLSH